MYGSDGHTSWVNNAVLQKAGINKAFIDQLDNSTKKYFGVDADGVPNGFIADSGFDKLNPILPKENTDWIKAGEKAMEYNTESIRYRISQRIKINLVMLCLENNLTRKLLFFNRR